MKRILFTILASIAVSVCGFAQSSQAQIIAKINQYASSLKSMECDFVQTKHMKILGKDMVAKGKMYYQQPEQLRWEYVSPYQYVFILNGDKVLLEKNAKKNVIDVNKNKIFKDIASLMLNSVVGKCLTDTKTFKVTMKSDTKSHIAVLLPQKKDLKQMYKQIVVHFDKKTFTVTKVEMQEKNGDLTEIELINTTTNQKINASKFTIR